VKDVLKNLKLNENVVSTLMGAVVVVLAGVLLLNFFKSARQVDTSDRTSSAAIEIAEPAISTEEPVTVVEISPANPGQEYVVQQGDSLWKIADAAYGTGYSWSKIYDANRGVIGQNPSVLEAGTRLALPDSLTAVVEHTVVRGDNLWNISLQYCGSGSSWSSIAAQNNLANPRLIEPGLKLTITCN